MEEGSSQKIIRLLLLSKMKSFLLSTEESTRGTQSDHCKEEGSSQEIIRLLFLSKNEVLPVKYRRKHARYTVGSLKGRRKFTGNDTPAPFVEKMKSFLLNTEESTRGTQSDHWEEGRKFAGINTPDPSNHAIDLKFGFAALTSRSYVLRLVKILTSYLPRLFKKDMLTDPEVFLKIISQNQDN